MKKEWKLWPKSYRYSFHSIIWGVGFDLLIAILIGNSIGIYNKSNINNNPVSYQAYIIPVCGILLISFLFIVLGISRNIKVYKLRKELELIKSNFQCYEGTISSIERNQVNDVMKNQAGNRRNKYTYSVEQIVVDYIDVDGRKRIATSEEYSENLSAFLKDTKANVYVSKNGNNRIVDDLSWRQSWKDDYINVPGEETRDFIKNVYYCLARWGVIIELLIIVITYLVIYF